MSWKMQMWNIAVAYVKHTVHDAHKPADNNQKKKKHLVQAVFTNINQHVKLNSLNPIQHKMWL